jgi:hypothetical protein
MFNFSHNWPTQWQAAYETWLPLGQVTISSVLAAVLKSGICLGPISTWFRTELTQGTSTSTPTSQNSGSSTFLSPIKNTGCFRPISQPILPPPKAKCADDFCFLQAVLLPLLKHTRNCAPTPTLKISQCNLPPTESIHPYQDTLALMGNK